MAYDENLAERVRNLLKEKRIAFEEKKMMGGWCLLIDDKMCVGVIKDSLMARVDPDIHTEILNRPGCREMDFTGRPMKGYVFVDPDGVDLEKDLEEWVQLCLDFNPRAKSSKKK